MTKRLAATAIAAVLLVLLPACPPESIVGTWVFFDCEGTPEATVRFFADGTMSYEASGGGGTGTWTEVDGQVDFMATVQFSAQGLLLFSGTVIDPDRIEGASQSDQAPYFDCAVMLR